MNAGSNTERFDTVVIGGGQAGLAVGYHLAKEGRDFVILDANDRVGDSWRKRWDSLRLFTPAKYSGLPGLPFPAPGRYLPTKDEVADYLETYATRFGLPVRGATKVFDLAREGDHYIVSTDNHSFEAAHVVVATSPYQRSKIPTFSSELDPEIMQIHSSEYRNPEQLRDGDVLVVGAGNSGAEIALEQTQTRHTWLSGRSTGRIPSWVQGRAYWWLFHRVMNVDTKPGQRIKARSSRRGDPLIGFSLKDCTRAGGQLVPRVAGVTDGKPILEDGRVLDVSNVIWATGFGLDFSWISLPGFGEAGYPVHYRGVVEGMPGLYFIGLRFLYTVTSTLLGGVGRDAEYITNHIAAERNHHGSPSFAATERTPEAVNP